MASGGSLSERASASPWIQEVPGLAEAVTRWEADLEPRRSELSARAVEVSRPGPPDPTRTARHVTAAGISRAIRIGTRLPADLRDLTPLRDPQGWLREAGVEAFADQLALGGPATAEVARLITAAGRLFPSELVAELERRSISAPEIDRANVEEIVWRAFEQPVSVSDQAIVNLPLAQLHAARLPDGSRVAVRVRRPGVTRHLLSDTRLSASLLAPLQSLLPQMGGLQPLGFVQLTTRQTIEAVDFRLEALNSVELGLVVESSGIEGLHLSRPHPEYVTERVLVSELRVGTPLSDPAASPDPLRTLSALTALTLQSALIHGVFWADPAPDHVLVLPDGSIAIVGVGTVGRLSPELRLAGILLLKSVLSGDAEGQVEAMRRIGAIDPTTDVDALIHDLSTSERLQVGQMLMGGEAGLLGGLNEAVRLMLKHHIQPPLDVVLLLRTVFALGALAERLIPEGGGLTTALLPLLQQLPDILAEAEASVQRAQEPRPSQPDAVDQ
jgi:ubiquinone biosynthesis protein